MKIRKLIVYHSVLYTLDQLYMIFPECIAQEQPLKPTKMDILLSAFINANNFYTDENTKSNLWIMFIMGPIFQLLGSILLDPFTPDQVQSCSIRKFQWRTTYLARIAAGITGVWAVVALHQSPQIQSDLMFGSSSQMVNLITFSIGVYISEMMDMVIHRQFSLLTIHHLAVIACFSGAIINNKAIGFAVLTLVTELNAVTNKTRILHIISDTDTMSVKYRTNAITNIFTFFIRILIIFWMNNQSFLYFMQEPTVFFGCCSLGLMFVNLWNLQVFKTLIVKDILVKSKTA